MELILYSRADGRLAYRKPSENFIAHAMLLPGIGRATALDIVAASDVPVRLTEDGIMEINGKDETVLAGRLVRRVDAESSSIAHEDIPFEIVDETDIPTDRTFRNAWQHDTSPAPEKVTSDMAKAIPIAHAIRREQRATAFRPHDENIAAQVPGADTSGAETARAAIRAGDATKQSNIDAATTDAELLTALNEVLY